MSDIAPAHVELARLISPADTIEIELGVDWGTSSFSVGYRIIGTPDGPTTPQPVMFKHSERVVPMVATWYQGRFVHGFELQRLRRDGEVRLEDTIEYFKLALYADRDRSTSTRVEEVTTQLASFDKTLDHLIEDHLRAILQDSLHAISSTSASLKISQDVLRNLPVKLRLSVPQMWSPRACQRMQDAAKRTGIPSVVALASEPQCSLAFRIQQMALDEQILGTGLNEGDLIIVADLGAGTGDVVGFIQKSTLAANSIFEAVSTETGEMCGSQKINDYILTALERSGDVEDRGGLERLCASLRLEIPAFRKLALRDIERIKLDFNNQKSGVVYIGHEDDKSFIFRVTEKMMTNAFEAVIKDVTAMLDTQMQTRVPKAIFVAGGLANSEHLMAKITERYEPQGIRVFGKEGLDTDYHVSLGALYRYRHISAAQNLPSQYSYALVQDKECDSETQPEYYDTKYRKRWVGPKGQQELQMKPYHCVKAEFQDEVKANPINLRKSLLTDRLYVMFEKGEIITPDAAKPLRISQLYHLPVGAPVLTATIVYSHEELRDGASSGRKERDGDEFREGIELLKNVEKRLDPAWLQRHKVPVVKDSFGGRQYKIYGELEVKYRGGHELAIGWKFLVGQGRSKRWETVWEDDDTVWDANFSQFVEDPVSQPVEKTEAGEMERVDTPMADA